MDIKLENTGWNMDYVKSFKSSESFVKKHIESKYLQYDEDKRKLLLEKVYSIARPVQKVKKSATKED